MPNGAETLTTIQLIAVLKNPEHTLYTAAGIEIEDRVIEASDADDDTQHRGGIRPGHAPILP